MSEKRYEFTLSPDLLEKAVTELNEPRDNNERLKAIDCLKEAFLKKYGDKYTLIRSDDAFLLRFLRSKKFDQEKALKVLGNYHYCRKDIPEVFDKMETPALLKETLTLGFQYVLPHKDKNGVTVWLYRDGLLKDDVDLMNVLAACMLSLEKELESEEFQINGMTCVEDMKGMSLKIVAKMSMSVMRKMAFMTQDAMPIRYKMMHIVNEGKFYDVVFQLIKPFLSKKMKERIKVHGTDFSKLHEYIDPQYLPDDLGGTGGDPKTASIKYGEELCQWKEGVTSTRL